MEQHYEQEYEESPFKVTEGEKLTEGKRQSERGRYMELNELQKTIILTVNQFLFMDSRMLCRYITKVNHGFDSEQILGDIIALFENEYLDGMHFATETEVFPHRIYKVGRKGRGFLKHINVRVRMFSYVETIDPVQAKKLLVTNQALIGMMQEDEADKIITARMIVCDKKYDKNNKKLFRILGMYLEQDSAIIVEPIRNNKDNLQKLIEKLERIDKTLQMRNKCDLTLPQDVTLLIIAENEQWMEYYREKLEKQCFKNFRLAMSYDKLTVADPEHMLIYLGHPRWSLRKWLNIF